MAAFIAVSMLLTGGIPDDSSTITGFSARSPFQCATYQTVHLACHTDSEPVILLLRERKNRNDTNRHVNPALNY